MEGNGYFMPLRNEKRFTPYEFDNLMSRNENRMDTLGKIIDQDIYNCMMSDRKTPLVLTPKLILDNSNNNPISQTRKGNNFNNQSQPNLKSTLREINNESFNILRSPRSPRNINSYQSQNFRNDQTNRIDNNKDLEYNGNNDFIQYGPKELKKQSWNYDRPVESNTERRYSPRMVNNEYYPRNNETSKINQYEFNNRYEEYPEQKYNHINNPNYRSQAIRNLNNNYEYRRPTPYNDRYDQRNFISNNRYNKDNYIDNYEENKKNDRRIYAPTPRDNFNQRKKDYDQNENNNYIKRGFYNSQLNFPFDRYED